MSDQPIGVLRIRNPRALAPLHAVMIALLGATVGGAALLLSAPETVGQIDGTIPWHQESVIRAVVQLLCLQYQFPTLHAGEIKNYILAIGTGLALISLGIAMLAGRRSPADDERPLPQAAAPLVPGTRIERMQQRHSAAPLFVAQITAILYLAWSFASSRWSAAPPLAVGGSISLAIGVLWAICLGCSISRAAARICCSILVFITGACALVAVWYYYARNPVLRAKFPFGNPIFLAEGLTPGIMVAIGLIVERVASFRRSRSARSALMTILYVAILAVSIWAFVLSGSRGPAVGILFGLIAMTYCVLRSRWRLIPVVLALVLLIGGIGYAYQMSTEPHTFGRSASMRTRLYAWKYAIHLSKQHPIKGHGQGGFTLAGDAHATQDVLADPNALKDRIAHAHNEWIEVLCDLGLVGLAIVVCVMLLTFRAGMLTIRGSPGDEMPWSLVGLLGAFVSLTAAESLGVGLRVAGVATFFFTVLGLIWASCTDQAPPLTLRLTSRRPRRLIASAVCCTTGIIILWSGQNDFLGARNAFRAEKALGRGEWEEATQAAAAATNRLSPQRSLTAQARLAVVHMQFARMLEQQASDRERRATQSDLVDEPLLAAASLNRRQSEEHCAASSAALKQLVAWSPGFLNHGRIEYWINLVRARNSTASNDADARNQALKAAASAISREMARQPYDPSIAIDYINVAGAEIELVEIVRILARPLRHGRVDANLTDTLLGIDQRRNLQSHFDKALGKPVSIEDWHPEQLRLAGALFFQFGDFSKAREAQEKAAAAYETLIDIAPIGVSACLAELSVSLFYESPLNPQPALDAVTRAVEQAPDSYEGRRIKRSAKSRMASYFLAAGNEEQARSLLAELSLSTASQWEAELSRQYHSLCHSLLAFEETYEKSAQRVAQWADRARELADQDPLVQLLSARIARRTGDCSAAEQHLRMALIRGLNPDWALQFIGSKLATEEECVELLKIRDQILASLAPQKVNPGSQAGGDLIVVPNE